MGKERRKGKEGQLAINKLAGTFVWLSPVLYHCKLSYALTKSFFNICGCSRNSTQTGW